MRKLVTLRLIGLMFLALASSGLAGCNGDSDNEGDDDDAPIAQAGDAAEGAEVYASTCATCHGPDAMGLPSLGKNLHNNAFVAERTDDEMLAFLKVGRPAGDPLNTTGVDMPPKGGNPALDDEDLKNVTAYVRTLK